METSISKLPCITIGLYDRLRFADELAIKKYICAYKNSKIWTPLDTIDKNAYMVFERTINPNLNSSIYVCIKIGDKMREDLKENNYE